MEVSDLSINSGVRGILAKHRVDLEAIRFGSFRGIVRLAGELRPLNRRERRPRSFSLMESVEYETKRIHGVRRVHFDLANWSKDDTGNWIEIPARAA